MLSLSQRPHRPLSDVEIGGSGTIGKLRQEIISLTQKNAGEVLGLKKTPHTPHAPPTSNQIPRQNPGCLMLEKK